MKNKFYEELINSKQVKDYNEMYRIAQAKTEQLHRELKEIYMKIQSLSENLISSKRVMVDIDEANPSQYSWRRAKIGLGTKGLGFTYYHLLEYYWNNIINHSKDFYKHRLTLRKGVKISYVNRFDVIMRCLKKLKEIEAEFKTSSMDYSFLYNNYNNKVTYNKISFKSDFVYGTFTNFLEDRTDKVYPYSQSLHDNNISQDITLNHYYNIIVKEGNKHIDELNNRIALLDKFMDSKAWKDFMKAYNNKRIMDEIL